MKVPVMVEKEDLVQALKNSKKADWYEIAQNEVGVKEIPGSDHNPRVLEYHKETSLKATRNFVVLKLCLV